MVLGIVNAAVMDETYGTYVDDECFCIHDYDDTNHDSDDDTDDDTDYDNNDDTDDVLMMVGAGSCILSQLTAAVSRFPILVVLGPWPLTAIRRYDTNRRRPAAPLTSAFK